MPLLFSYGTLQEEPVQLSTLGRRLEGQAAELVGYEPATVAIQDPKLAARLGKTHHANVLLTGDENARVPGTVFDVSDADVRKIDAFESAFSYTRIAARLGSGLEAWVYVHTP